MENIKPGNHERGWNDPPQFLYDGQRQPGTKPAGVLSNLKKRVGHDLSSTNQSTSNQSSLTNSSTAYELPSGPISQGHADAHIEPPQMLTPVPILNVSKTSDDNSEVASSTEKVSDELELPSLETDQDKKQYCLNCFKNMLETLTEQNLLQKRMADELTKKFSIFDQNWQNSKISKEAKPKCVMMARAIEARSFNKAYEVHLQLMTDHISEVSQWMVAVKKLIHLSKDLPASV